MSILIAFALFHIEKTENVAHENAIPHDNRVIHHLGLFDFKLCIRYCGHRVCQNILISQWPIEYVWVLVWRSTQCLPFRPSVLSIYHFIYDYDYWHWEWSVIAMEVGVRTALLSRSTANNVVYCLIRCKNEWLRWLSTAQTNSLSVFNICLRNNGHY